MPASNRAILASLKEIAAAPGGDHRAPAKVAELQALVDAEDAELERRVREEEAAKEAIRKRIAGGIAP